MHWKWEDHLRGTTATNLPTPTVLLWTWSPSPRYYREVGPHPRGVTVNSIPITAGKPWSPSPCSSLTHTHHSPDRSVGEVPISWQPFTFSDLVSSVAVPQISCIFNTMKEWKVLCALFQQSWRAKPSSTYMHAWRTLFGVTRGRSYGYQPAILSKALPRRHSSCISQRLSASLQMSRSVQFTSNPTQQDGLTTVCRPTGGHTQLTDLPFHCRFYLVNFSQRSAEYCDTVIRVLCVRCKLFWLV